MTDPETVDAIVPLCRFVADLDFDDLPDAAVEAAELHLLDTLGVAAPGGQADGIEILLTQLGAWGGRPEAHVLGSDLRLPAPWAVLANGAMIHAKEFEDVHAGAFVRPSGSVVPCALAAAELRGGVTGAELLTAMVAGYELICRVGRVVQRPISFTRTGALGALAGAATAAKVLGLDADRIHHAVGIAYAQSSTSIQAQLDGAQVKKLHAGIGAKAGIIGACLAQRGMTGNRNVLEGPYGYLKIYEPGPYDRSLLVDDLGGRFEITETGFKLFPSAIYTHAPIAAALRLHAAGVPPEDVQSLHFRVAEFAAAAGAKPYADVSRDPVGEAMFSIPYLCAAAVVRGAVTLDDLTPEAVLDPGVAPLAQATTVEVDDGVPGGSLAPIQMTATLRSGTIIDETVDVVPGSPGTIERAQLVGKLEGCLAHAGPGWDRVVASDLADVALSLRSSDDAVKDLWTVLYP